MIENIKLLYYIFLALLILSCNYNPNNSENKIIFNLESRLDQDVKGYYHLELNPSNFQTLHRISGHIYGDDEPLDVVRFNWRSSHYWTLGDTLGYLILRDLTDDLVYVSYDTTYITGFSDFVVPTINCCGYSNSDGEVNTMFAPVWTMRYDTVLVSISYFIDNTESISQSIEIVLE